MTLDNHHARVSIKAYYEVWQGGLVLGTIVLAVGILRLFYPFEALPYSTELCFIGAGVAYFFSFISFRRFTNVTKEKLILIGILSVTIIILSIFIYSLSTQDWNNPIFRWTSQISNGQCCDNSWVDQYYYGDKNNYDESKHDCKEGYVSSWDSGTVFYCVSPEQAKQDCMVKYPTQYQISNGQVFQRSISLQDNHQLCASLVGTAVGVNRDITTNITPDEYAKMKSNGSIVGDGSN